MKGLDVVAPAWALGVRCQATHPLIESDAIIERQKAIQFLIEHPELRIKIKTLLETLENVYGSNLPRYLEELASRHPNGSYRGRLLTGAVGTTLGAAAVYLGFHPEHLREGATAIMPMVYMGLHNVDNIRWSRDRIKPLKKVISLADSLNADLTSTSSDVLQSIGKALSAVHDPNHELHLAEVSRSVRKMVSNEIVTIFGSLTYLLNGSTEVLRGKVIKNKEGLEILLATIADLDVLTGCAELYAQNRDNYSFPKILPAEQNAYLKIESGHHPFVLDDIKEKSVPNSIEMSTEGGVSAPSFLLLTGPNTGGKSTYLRMLATNVVLAQIGAPVAAKSMVLTPLSLMTNMNV